jgi:hypothetical protein
MTALEEWQNVIETLAEEVERSCSNCVHSISPDPKCGMCGGPNWTGNTRYERIINVVRHNSPTPTEVPGTVRQA